MNFSRRITIGIVAATLCCTIAAMSHAAAPPDAGLFTTYSFNNNYSRVQFEICGSVPGSDGCYGSGAFGPFGYVGAISENGPLIHGDMISRYVFVVDVASGAGGTDVVLYRYEITNSVSPPYDKVTSKLTGQVSLPLAGGANVRCSLASDNGFLFVGTDQSPFAVRVAKNGFALQSIGGFSNNPTVAAITVNDYGFVVITFGGNAGGPGGIVVFDPSGNATEDGGGASFTLPSRQGLSTKDLPTYTGL